MKNLKGFTLIELVIVIGIVGLISAIAYPSYVDYVVRGKRAEGMAALTNAAQAMERFRVANYTYTLPNDLSDVFATQVPVDGQANAYYNLTVVTTATTYTLTATPTGSLAGEDDPLTLTNTGAKTWGAKTCWPENGPDC